MSGPAAFYTWGYRSSCFMFMRVPVAECICAFCRSRDYHKSIRNAWNPAFFSQSLEGYASLMNSGAEGMLRRLGKAAARGQEIDIWRTLGDMTMAVVGSASFGYVPSLLSACCCTCKVQTCFKRILSVRPAD